MKKKNLAQLAAALADAQSMMMDAKQNQKNTFTKSSYADLTSVWSACRDALTKNGLSVVQRFEPQDADHRNVLITVLLHVSGESIESRLPLLGVQDWHSLGSAITYARRYSLCAMVGIAPDGDDDDGNVAQGKTRLPSGSRKSYPKRKSAAETKAEALQIIGQVDGAGEYLRNKETDPGDPPPQACKRIVDLGVDGLRKQIEKAQKEAESEKIVDAAEKVEKVEDAKEGGAS